MARSPKTHAAGRGGNAKTKRSPTRKRADRAAERAAPRAGAAAGAHPAPHPEEPRPRAQPRGGGRQESRLTINKEFESFDAFVSEYVSNLSRSGVFVRTRKPLPVGTKVDLRFTVLMDNVEIVEGVGEVVRVHEDPAGMGLVFRELSGYSEAIIERLLTAQALGAPKGR
jgi:uncharacterized protein (TIGR02266 family)